jgi:RimJ/RimL family protein N-acetyltransferase
MEFKLRPWNKEDLPSLVHHANNWNVAKNLMDRFPHPYTEADGIVFLSTITNDDPVQHFAIDINEQAVGGIGIHPQPDIYRKNAELGYWLAEPFWGKGIVTKAIQQMVAYGFSHFEINRIFARPFGTNLASQRVLEKAGFRLEGRFQKTIFKNGEYIDELVYAIRKDQGRVYD